MNNEIHFEQVITVINDKPYKYWVKAGDHPDLNSDPLSRNPVLFIFTDNSDRSDIDRKSFKVEVISRFAEGGIHNILKEIRNEIIRFGLWAIRKDSNKKEFLLNSDRLEEFRESISLTGQRLKKDILKFIFVVNSNWPDLGISVSDLEDNYKNSRNELSRWIKQIHDENKLIRLKIDKKFHVNRGNVIEAPYKINPEKFDEISKTVLEQIKKENDKSIQKSVKVFLSYSTRNKTLIEKLMEEIENYGIETFVAQYKLRPSVEWMDMIEENLNNCDYFIPILTPEFTQSVWANQESGYAYAIKKIIIPFKTNTSSNKKDIQMGFLQKFQYAILNKQNIGKSCETIIEKICDDKDHYNFIKDCLIEKFRLSEGFTESIELSNRLNKFSGYSKSQIKLLISNIESNDQIYECGKALENLKIFLKKNKKIMSPSDFDKMKNIME